MSKLVRVKVIQQFVDAETSIERKVDDIFECSEERANVLTSYEMGEIAFPLVEVLEVIEEKKAEAEVKTKGTKRNSKAKEQE